MDTFSIKDFALKEFNDEMITTRKLLERVPFDKFDWKPHAKSTPLGKLAIHVATLPGMGAEIFTKESLSFDGSYKPLPITTTADLLAAFDGASGATRAALEAITDEAIIKPWSLIFKKDGDERKLYEGTRIAAFQSIMMNHHIHHRAQLGVYLRLNDVEIPGSYGPSADEPM